MLNTRKTHTAIVVTALIALAGCQMASPPPMRGPAMGPGPMAAAPQMNAFEGDWMSTDGVAISRFTGGRFETLATDTGNKLAEGNYNYVDQSTVSISVTSLIRQTTTQVNCAMASTAQLNCTSSAGQQFSLMRRQGMS